jgi:hypothetical protein
VIEVWRNSSGFGRIPPAFIVEKRWQRHISRRSAGSMSFAVDP